MRKTIVLTFTAAALLMAAAFALGICGREIFEGQMQAVDGLPRFSMYECYDCGAMMESWEKAAVVAFLLGLSFVIAGAMLWQAETPAPSQRLLVLGLNAGTPRGVASTPAPTQSAVVIKVRAHVATLPRADEADGLTPLERVIRGY